jgi:probable selenium-dependent hydroxylase accessory protein YqeC
MGLQMLPLSDLLYLPPRPLISIVGAGGKTTTMYTLAAELAAQGKKIITTTTTNIYVPQADETDTLIVATETPMLLDMVRNAWQQYSHVTVANKVMENGKLAGVSSEQPFELLQNGGADIVIVEADGARHKMIKAPAEHEPVVPPQTNVALIVMSAEALNQPLNAEIAHRSERIAALLDIEVGDMLTPALIARLLTDEQGGLKNIPQQAVIQLLITHVSPGKHEFIRELASLVRRSPRVSGVCGSSSPGEWFGIS